MSSGGENKTKAEKREEKSKVKIPRRWEVGQKMLVRKHQLSNAEHNEIKKLFNLFEGPMIIDRIFSESTVLISNPTTKKKQR